MSYLGQQPKGMAMRSVDSFVTLGSTQMLRMP